VLRECRQEPLQFHWFRAAAKFLNSLLSGNSGLLTKIVHLDIALGASCRKCWTAEFIEACVGLRIRAADTYANCIKAATPLPLQDFVVDLCERLRVVCIHTSGGSWMVQILGHTLKNWLLILCMDGLASQTKQCTAPRGPPHLLPTSRYLELELSRHVLRDIACFLLRAHALRVETGCWQVHNRLCDRCDLHDFQDE